MNLRRTMTAFMLATNLVYAGGLLAQAPVTDPRDLDERLKRLERLFDSGGLFKLFEDVKSQDIEIGRLQGQLEELAHTINQLRQGQRELYRDIDQRLQRIESAPTAQAANPSPQPAVPPAASAAPAQTTAPANQPATPPAAAAPRTTPTAETQAATPATGDGVDPFAEQQAYQSAFDLLKSGRYEDAAAAFQQFLAAYPGGSYADNAQYWLGETHYITRRYKSALEEFERLVSKYPGSQKLAGALLKIGYTHDELGNKAEAERVLDDLVTRYPRSAAAGLARKRLLRIRGQ